MYLDNEKTPQIMEIVDNRLGWDLDLEDRYYNPWILSVSQL